MKKLFCLGLVLSMGLASCKKEKKEEPAEANNSTPTTTVEPCANTTCSGPLGAVVPDASKKNLIFKFFFDSTQVRLNNLGMPATVPSTNAACSPVFNAMSAHYIELASDDVTAVGAGKVLYRAPETTCDQGENAINFCSSRVVGQNGIFFSIPLSEVVGTFKWLRVSLAYQNYDIPYRVTSCSATQWGTVASFIGFNTYVKQFTVKNQTVVPTASCTTHGTSGGGNVKQGYWAFESNVCNIYPLKVDGKSAGTTVVNPLSSTSPIPAGSCLVTGRFNTGGMDQNITITGNETSDIIITVSLSTNKSFEWKETTFDGYYQPEGGEFPVDMGIRGMIAKY